MPQPQFLHLSGHYPRSPSQPSSYTLWRVHFSSPAFFLALSTKRHWPTAVVTSIQDKGSTQALQIQTISFFLPLNFGGPVGGLSRHFFGAPKFQAVHCVCVGGLFSHISGLQWAHKPPPPWWRCWGSGTACTPMKILTMFIFPYSNVDLCYLQIV